MMSKRLEELNAINERYRKEMQMTGECSNGDSDEES